MARVVVDPDARRGDGFLLEGDAFRHAVKVLRLRAGDSVCVVDGSGVEHCCVVEAVSARDARARVLESRPLTCEVCVRVSLYCALLKGEKLDWVLQKATEIGVARCVFFESARSVVRRAAVAGRAERWRRIAAAAAAQSGQGAAPEVPAAMAFAEAVADAARCSRAVILWEGERVERLAAVLGRDPRPATLAIMIGPEGGFEAGEIERARAAGLIPATLGRRILRAETAAVTAPALAAYHYGDLG